MARGRLGRRELVPGAHLEQQVAEADDVDVVNVRGRAGPDDGVDARVEPEQSVLQAG